MENLPGVGPSTAKLFARMNIFTVSDLLQTYPRDYEDRTRRVLLKDFAQSKVHTVCRVVSHDWFGYGKMRTLKIFISDGSADAVLVSDEIKRLPYLFDMMQKVMKKIKVNIIASIIINLSAVILSAFGVLTPITGALWHNFGSVFVVVNAALLLRKKGEE